MNVLFSTVCVGGGENVILDGYICYGNTLGIARTFARRVHALMLGGIRELPGRRVDVERCRIARFDG
jgi:hypothetical protein